MSSLPTPSRFMARAQKQTKGPFIIGVCGGTASGKTTVCKKITEELKDQRVVVISQDSFYRSLNEEQLKRAHVGEYNFDHPDAFEYELIEETLAGLKTGEPVQIPEYSFVEHKRMDTTTTIFGADVILFEGILIFYSKALRDAFDMKIFVDADSDVRLARRVVRDIRERGRDLEGVLLQYTKFVKPAFDDYILPTKKYADIIMPRGAENQVALGLIVQHIAAKLGAKEKRFPDTAFLDSPVGSPAVDTSASRLSDSEGVFDMSPSTPVKSSMS